MFAQRVRVYVAEAPDRQAQGRGVRAALSAAGLELQGEVMYSEWSERWGRDAAALLMAQHPDVDAIACGSDQIARGVLDTLRDLDRRVPEDVAVTGYDNWEALTTHSRPELTSIDANLQQLGREAARSLFQAMGSTANKPRNRTPPGPPHHPGLYHSAPLNRCFAYRADFPGLVHPNLQGPALRVPSWSAWGGEPRDPAPRG
jgi:DNA-binding LacI/PurR family transcriptional regulator